MNLDVEHFVGQSPLSRARANYDLVSRRSSQKGTTVRPAGSRLFHNDNVVPFLSMTMR